MSTSSSRPGSEMLQKMQPVLAPPEPVTYALLHGAQRRSMRGWLLDAGGWMLVAGGWQLGSWGLPVAGSSAPRRQHPAPMSDRERVGRWNRGRSALRGGRLLVDQFLQLFARFEVRDLLRRHVDLVAGLRVAPLPRLPLAQAEAAEPAQLDLLAAVQRLDDAAEDGVDDHLGVFLRQIRDARHFLDQLRLRHAPVGHT